jgi:hypothetical protein
MRQISTEFELNPGFEVKGAGEIKTCRVRLLTRTERDLCEQVAHQEAVRQIAEYNEEAAAKKIPKMSQEQQDSLLRRMYKRQFLIGSIHSFGRIDDAEKVRQWYGLLVFPDEERIEEESIALMEKFRPQRKRSTHICSQCGEQTQCPRAVQEPNKVGTAVGDSGRNDAG